MGAAVSREGRTSNPSSARSMRSGRVRVPGRRHGDSEARGGTLGLTPPRRTSVGHSMASPPQPMEEVSPLSPSSHRHGHHAWNLSRIEVLPPCAVGVG